MTPAEFLQIHCLLDREGDDLTVQLELHYLPAGAPYASILTGGLLSGFGADFVPSPQSLAHVIHSFRLDAELDLRIEGIELMSDEPLHGTTFEPSPSARALLSSRGS